MMYIDNEVLEKMIMTMVEGFNRLEKKLDRMNRLKDCLDGDTLLDNCDLAQLLGVTQRTIARYREKGLIRYYQTDIKIRLVSCLYSHCLGRYELWFCRRYCFSFPALRQFIHYSCFLIRVCHVGKNHDIHKSLDKC